MRIGKVLVTGGLGFIGSHTCDHLVKSGYQVVVFDDLSMGKKQNISSYNHVEFVQGDISKEKDVEELFYKHEFIKIFHLAAVASVAESIAFPNRTNEVNFQGTLNLLSCAKKQGNIERFVFASSAAVYGDDPVLPKKETSKIKPLSPYAVDKFASEQYVLMYSKLYGVHASAVRFFNVYGPRQNPKSQYSGVLSILLDSFGNLNSGKDVYFNLYGNGNQTRDFVYIKDVIQALEIVSNHPDAVGNVYNVGTGSSVSLNEVISIFERLGNQALPIKQLDSRQGDIEHSHSAIENLTLLGYKPKFTIERGLSAYWKEIYK